MCLCKLPDPGNPAPPPPHGTRSYGTQCMEVSRMLCFHAAGGGAPSTPHACVQRETGRRLPGGPCRGGRARAARAASHGAHPASGARAAARCGTVRGCGAVARGASCRHWSGAVQRRWWRPTRASAARHLRPLDFSPVTQRRRVCSPPPPRTPHPALPALCQHLPAPREPGICPYGLAESLEFVPATALGLLDCCNHATVRVLASA